MNIGEMAACLSGIIAGGFAMAIYYESFAIPAMLKRRKQ